MPRRNSFNTFVAMAAGAASVVTAIEYARQKRAAQIRVAEGSQMIDTQLGPAEIALIGDGPAVLFVHGALAGYDQGLLAGKLLAEAGYQVISLSRPGYLRTPATPDMSFAGQADFLAAVLDALKVRQAIVIGLSAGGPSAIQLAARHPDRCRALILLCAISQQAIVDPETETMTSWMFGNLMQSDFLTWLGVQAMLKSLPLLALAEPGGWRARVLASPQRRARYEKLLWALFPSSPRLLGAQNDRELVEQMDALPFKRVTAPTLVMHGTDDALVPFSHGENSAERIAGARFVPISGADHGFFVSHDDVVWPEVIAFLKRPATAARRGAPKKPAARKPAAKKIGPETKARPARTTRGTPATRPGAAAPRRRRPPAEG
jgi:pimeloyl-ACP methyl ester carboxylesterase